MSNGKTVLCTIDVCGEEVHHWVDRSICLLETRPACSTCPNSQFEVLFQIRIGDQMVACPRWEDQNEMRQNKDPDGYVFTKRYVCLTEKPFPFCIRCPNANSSNPPRDTLKWFEREERQRQIEEQLDKEEMGE
jgi:hypothetical protein